MAHNTHGEIFRGFAMSVLLDPGSGRRGTVETSAAEEVAQGNADSPESGWEGANSESSNSTPTRSSAASQPLGRSSRGYVRLARRQR
jgi:hypothetical protein